MGATTAKAAPHHQAKRFWHKNHCQPSSIPPPSCQQDLKGEKIEKAPILIHLEAILFAKKELKKITPKTTRGWAHLPLVPDHHGRRRWEGERSTMGSGERMKEGRDRLGQNCHGDRWRGALEKEDKMVRETGDNNPKCKGLL
jgi:hypothetical protein